jgi:hypothetical protein
MCRRGYLLLAAALLALGVSSARAQKAAPNVVRFAPDRLLLLPSPDNHWTLANGCHGCPAGRVLWLANNADHHRRLVRKYERTVQVRWSPDSSHFFLNDESTPDLTRAYVLDAVTLKATELEQLIAAADADALRYLHAGRSYLAAQDWPAADDLLVTLSGRFVPPPGSSDVGYVFELRYRVKLDGAVIKIFAHEWDPDSVQPTDE